MKGWQNQVDYGMRVYDPRIGRFLSVDPLTRDYPSLTPYQYASNTPTKLIDIDGQEGGVPPKPDKPGTKTGDRKTTQAVEEVATPGGQAGCADCFTKTVVNYKTWYYYAGDVDRNIEADWYSKQEYDLITQDWENGQVLPKANFLQRFDLYRSWYGWEVDHEGYLTGRLKARGGAGNLEHIDGHSLTELTKLAKGRAFLKEGDYLIYFGFKGGKPYIGSTTELLARYSKKEIDELNATVFYFFQMNPTVRKPNRGIAIGFVQMVIKLNYAGENITKANRGTLLANEKNAAIKPIYLEAAEKWAKENIPNWQELFKIKRPSE